MDCIYCGHSTRVINSRPQKRLKQVWRRRACPNCQNVFTTLEKAELTGAVVVATEGSAMVAFQRDRLFASLLAVCGHRPAAIDDASALTDTVIARLRPNMASGRLSPADIIKTAQNVLQHFDTAAAVQYNAYHHL